MMWIKSGNCDEPIVQPLYQSELTLSLVALVAITLANTLQNLPDNLSYLIGIGTHKQVLTQLVGIVDRALVESESLEDPDLCRVEAAFKYAWVRSFVLCKRLEN